jgi:hypothetical protein
LNRRSFLKFCSLALGGCGLGNLMELRAQAKESGKSVPDTSVIFIWLPGGPPHMETFDMKPDAPAEFRGEYRPIKTNVPGIDICEHLPQLARVADRFSLIRSIAHRFSDHGGGHKRFLTGRDPLEPVGFVNDHPMVGSMVACMRENLDLGIPNYVAGTDGGRHGIDVFSFGSAYLDRSTHPFMVAGDPNDPKFQVNNLTLTQGLKDHMPGRLSLLKQFDQTPRQIDHTGTMAAMDVFNEKALRMLTGSKAQTAFDLNREPDRLRDRYGRHRYGQRCLMARRLIEAGCSFVTMVLENPGYPWPKDATYNWDSHAVNCHIFVDTKFKLGFLDQAISALIEDLHLRGLNKQVLLIVTGEFGRTPRISYANDRPGRDHWPQAMSVLVSGGGLKMGQIVGSTNARGEHPKDRPLTPNDLWATMFRHLDIDYLNTSFLDHGGRPMPILPYGQPIEELG